MKWKVSTYLGRWIHEVEGQQVLTTYLRRWIYEVEDKHLPGEVDP